ncbi:hypothetical protein WJX77_004487 [Trebouxia sp. C0004]
MTLPVQGLFFIVPPHGFRKGEADDFQPYLDIIADQLRSAYWDGIGEVVDGSWKYKSPAERAAMPEVVNPKVKVPGYDDRDSRNPEPMHNTGNEVSAVTVMALGGTAAIYSVARLKEVTDWETDHNSDGQSSRWLRQLRPYSTGCKDIPNLDWTATPQALSTAKQRCEDMRIYDDVVCVPPGIRTVEFEKALGSAGKVKTWEYLLMAGPYGKYLLEDCFHPEVQVVVFE